MSVILALAAGYVLWTLAHELSHLGMARLCVGVSEWSLKPYPHRLPDGSWRFASARWTAVREADMAQRAAISLAPRALNLAAVVMFWLPTPGPWWTAFWACGLVDLWVGSWGGSERSDLKKAARALDISPWWLRVMGWTSIALAGVGYAL